MLIGKFQQYTPCPYARLINVSAPPQFVYLNICS